MRPTNGCQIQECLPKASLSFVSYLFAKSKTTAHILETIYLYTYITYSATPSNRRKQRASKLSAMDVLAEKYAKKAALKKEKLDLRKQELDFQKIKFDAEEQEKKSSRVRGGRQESNDFSCEEIDQLKFTTSIDNIFY